MLELNGKKTLKELGRKMPKTVDNRYFLHKDNSRKMKMCGYVAWNELDTVLVMWESIKLQTSVHSFSCLRKGLTLWAVPVLPRAWLRGRNVGISTEIQKKKNNICFDKYICRAGTRIRDIQIFSL